MYSSSILERFKNPQFAGGLRGANGTGKAGSQECGDIVKIYILVDEDGVIDSAKFKAYGGVSTIVACDVVCEMLAGMSLEEALSITAGDIMAKLEGDIPDNKSYSAVLAEEAVTNAVEDYYKRKEREERKN